WFCIPHQADDEYVREFARAVKTHLAPERRAYIEYSNEVWNSQFKQHHYAGKHGLDLGLGARQWEAAWHYYSQRSVEIFKIFESEFGGTERLVRVLASQAASAHVADQICGWNHAWEHADVLAIAPYIPLNIPLEGKDLDAAKVAAWSVEELLDYVEGHSLPDAKAWMQANKRIANRFKLKLVSYEAGQHFVGYAGAENNEPLTRLLHSANAHPRMKPIYRQYYQAWQEVGGDLLCHFSSVSVWNKWGSWGLLQYADEDAAASPKFSATLEWAKQLGQNVNVPGVEVEETATEAATSGSKAPVSETTTSDS
ncbi:MAG: hypothetical protein KDB23_15635, partial [Planctomycetales bacterium]|nr:hypothetical protein [Planctomycetales bacterium]